MYKDVRECVWKIDTQLHTHTQSAAGLTVPDKEEYSVQKYLNS